MDKSSVSNEQIREHVSALERTNWDRVYDSYFDTHLGKGGVANHMLATGAGTGSPSNPNLNTANGIPGFTQCNYTPNEKGKLSTVAWQANYYIHPATHPYTMITGLSTVAHTGVYNDLTGKPVFPSAADGCNAATVNGIRITIGISGPSSPINNKEVWFNTSNRLTYIYTNSTWIPWCAVFG